MIHYRSIHELSTSIVSSSPMEMSASPTALQDNSRKAKKSDGDRPTKEVAQDHIELATSIWSSTRVDLYMW